MIGDVLLNEEAHALANAAATVWQVPVKHIMGRRRGVEPVCNARQSAMKVLRYRGYSYEAIGKAFGRDHGTVLHGCRAVDGRLEVDKQFRKLWETFISITKENAGSSDDGFMRVIIECRIPNADKMNDGELAMAAAQRAILRNSRAKVKRERVVV